MPTLLAAQKPRKHPKEDESPRRAPMRSPKTAGLCKIPEGVAPEVLLSAAPIDLNELSGYCWDMTPKQLARCWVGVATNALAEELVNRELIHRTQARGLIGAFTEVLKVVRYRLIENPRT